MKLSEYWETFNSYTEKASDQARQFAFAGIAIVWLFAVIKGKGIFFPSLLYIALIFFVATLTCDLLQYFYASIAWHIFCSQKEKIYKNKEDDSELDAPNWINYPTNVLFILKILFVLGGFILLGIVLKDRIFLTL